VEWKKATQWLIVAVVVLAAAYDVIAMLQGGVQATISRRVWFWSKDMPIIPFLVGVLCGHLFFSQRVKESEK
jgi:peptidoglycan/LPS O-acetylase OafA/YrhL